jgi:hypothetical protein
MKTGTKQSNPMAKLNLTLRAEDEQQPNGWLATEACRLYSATLVNADEEIFRRIDEAPDLLPTKPTYEPSQSHAPAAARKLGISALAIAYFDINPGADGYRFKIAGGHGILPYSLDTSLIKYRPQNPKPQLYGVEMCKTWNYWSRAADILYNVYWVRSPLDVWIFYQHNLEAFCILSDQLSLDSQLSGELQQAIKDYQIGEVIMARDMPEQWEALLPAKVLRSYLCLSESILTIHQERPGNFRKVVAQSIEYERRGGAMNEQEETEPMMRKLMEQRHLKLETLEHYDIQADLEKKAWKYPVNGGFRYKAFSSGGANKYWSEVGLKNQLYGLENIQANTRRAYLLNGEPAVWAAWQDQIPAFCAFGEGNFPNGGIEQLKALNPGEIIIIADNDETGATASGKRKELLAAAGFKVRAVKLPAELGNKADFADLHNLHSGNAEAIKEALDNLEELIEPRAEPELTAKPTPSARNERLWELIKPHLHQLSQKANQEFACICPYHEDHKPSLALNLEKGIFYCFACEAKGTLLDLARKLKLELPAELAPKPEARSAKQVSTHATATELWEEVVQNGQAKFAHIAGAVSNSVEYVGQVEIEGKIIEPISAESEAIAKSAVVFPSQAEEYGSVEGLREELQQHIHRYLDITEQDEVFCIHYILLSWVYDRFTTIPYLGFRGDFGTGKSRAMQVVGGLCYKPCKIAGAVTPAPIYRLIEQFRGTLLIEEANLKDSSEANEVVKILNCGFEKANPIIRCNKDKPSDLQYFDPFCPKVVTTRGAFDDKALESRFYTIVLKGSDRVDAGDIPYVLGDRFQEEESRLRNRLLYFRLRSYFSVSAKNIEEAKLPNIEPRLKQAFSAFYLLLQNEPEALASLDCFLKAYNQKLVEERAETLEGKIIEKIFEIAEESGKEYISAGSILAKIGDEVERATPQGIGKRLNALGIETVAKRRPGDKQRRYIIWQEKLMERLKAKYVSEGVGSVTCW